MGPHDHASCRPIVSTGLSDVIGSWKIIETFAPRIGAERAGIETDQLGAADTSPTRCTVAPCRAGPSIASIVTLLPEPDSPTMASASPG